MWELEKLNISNFSEDSTIGSPIEIEGAIYWFDSDRYLSQVIRQNSQEFISKFDLFNETPLHLLPSCRDYAREKHFDKDSLETFLDWTKNNSLDINLTECLSLFFCEEVEHMFAKHFAKSFSTFSNTKTREESRAILIASMINLKGASMKRLAMQRWED